MSKLINCLLVERLLGIRELMSDRLNQTTNISVNHSCSQGSEAIRLLQQSTPDLVITDMGMLAPSGRDLIREIKVINKSQRCIYFTSVDNHSALRMMMSSGAEGIVSRQSPWESLLDAIERSSRGVFYCCPRVSELMRANPVEMDEQQQVNALSPREKQILVRFGQGIPMKEIAGALNISAKTAYNHFARLKQKLGVVDPSALILLSMRHSHLLEMESTNHDESVDPTH